MKTTLNHKLMLLLLVPIIGILSACNKNTDTPAGIATVSTATPIKVDDTTYTCGGNVTNQGSTAVTERGVAIALTNNPVINDPDGATIPIGNGTGAFSTNIAPFAAGYTFHIRAYAKNSSGIAYGADVTINIGTVSSSCDTVDVNKNITVPTTWLAGKVYMVRTWVNVNAPLVIQAGAIIKFKNSSCGMEVYAKITANGTSANPIIFTSYKDDSYCGDNNGDGAASTPSKGDWGRLTMRGDQHGSLFRYCKFLYGGGAGNGVVLANSGSGDIHDFTFDYCTFAHTYGNTSNTNAAFSGSNMHDASVSILTNNIFYDNIKPIYLGTYYALDPSNSFHNPANPSETNKYNGIFLWVYGLGNKSVAYKVTEVPYVFDGWLQVGAPDFLSVGPNVVFKFASSGSQISSHNASEFSINATAVFTSFKDDSRGGDTNGDGNASTPAANDWYGISRGTDGAYHTNVFYAAH